MKLFKKFKCDETEVCGFLDENGKFYKTREERDKVNVEIKVKNLELYTESIIQGACNSHFWDDVDYKYNGSFARNRQADVFNVITHMSPQTILEINNCSNEIYELKKQLKKYYKH